MAEKEQPSVTIRVRIGDNELEVTGPSDFVEKKIAEFREQQRVTSTEVTKQSPHKYRAQELMELLNPAKEMSVAQFFKKVTPKSDVDRVLAAGFFLEKFKKAENFTASEVSGIIRHGAKTQPPQNPNEAVNKNIRKGYMMAAGDKDGKMAFVLTSDGEEAIEKLLDA